MPVKFFCAFGNALGSTVGWGGQCLLIDGPALLNQTVKFCDPRFTVFAVYKNIKTGFCGAHFPAPSVGTGLTSKFFVSTPN